MALPSYVINFDELSDLLKNYLSNGIDVDISNISFNTTELERLLNDIKGQIQGVDYNNLITALNSLGVKLDGLSGNLGLSGIQKIYGKMLNIFYADEDNQGNIIEFIVPNNGKLTGITYSLSAWNHEDSWDLKVGNEQLFTTVTTKEYGEHKFLNVFYPITAGQKIQFIYNNVSQSNRILWVDFNILEG
jgi:hypothetical protein